MKDFMLIFIGKSYGEMGLSPEEMQGRFEKWGAWQQDMDAKGIVKGGHALEAEIRQIRGEQRTVTDIASAELKEIVGGYYIVSAKDLNEATEIAQGYPDYDLGGNVEVREIMVFK